MSTLKTQYQQWLENNPTATISYTDWLETEWVSSCSLPLQEKKVWDTVNRLKQEGKLTEPSQEDIENEPSALAFTPYDISEWDTTLMDGLEEEDFSDWFEEQPNLQEVHIRFPNESYFTLTNIDINQFKPEKTFEDCTFGWYGDIYVCIKYPNET